MEAAATSSPIKARRVAVIGAGITGLAAGYRLRELAAAREVPLEVTLVERSQRVGGPLESIRRDGFVIETGADSFLSEKPEARALAQRLGIDSELIPTREEFRRTLIVRNGRLVEIPEGFSLMAPTRLGPVLRSELFSPLGKMRIALEPLIPARRADGEESLASFVRRRLGNEVLDRVAQALAGGIYTADPEQLSLSATMPRFIEMERRYGSVYKGLRAAERARTSMSKGTSGARWNLFLSFRSGVGILPETLAAKLGGCIRTGTEVRSIAREGDFWRVTFIDGTSEDADAVICTVPAHAASPILSASLEPLARVLGEISYASAAVVNLVYRETNFPTHPRSFGFVVPIAEHRRIIAGSFSNLKYENRAPEGFISARAFIGGVLQTDMMRLSDDEMIAAARDEFRALLKVEAEPQFASVRRWPLAMPQYVVGHLARVAEIERLAEGVPAFALAGAAYRGVGIPDCIRSGEQAAEKILAHLAPAQVA
ncbi:MAG TPA: protoporphyrinogen oxidase [Candidatus Binataceae bacterium]|nr:protoporphyrinogen oxidase [Candidatus Binataceae bacterium]